jgi:phage terminase large subunit-like protein
MFAITTAGKPGESIYQDQHAYAEKVLERMIEDDTFFAYVAQLDPADDWEDERAWVKANPNLGISVKLDNLRELAHKAKNQPSALNAFLRLRLNRPAGDFARWIPIDKWNKCVGYDLVGRDAKSLLAEVLPTLAARKCVAAVDLSSKIDLTAYVKLFPPTDEDPRWILIPRFFMPEENVDRRVKEDRVPYDLWIREGFVTKTDGNVVDYDVVKAAILEDAKRYEMLELAFDPWGALQVSIQLAKEGLTVSEFRQGFASMSEPTKQFLALVLSNKLAHLANPVLKWMASNVVVKIDEAGNEKPNKRKSAERIDGIVAAIMALGRAMFIPEDSGKSVYDDRGVLFL